MPRAGRVILPNNPHHIVHRGHNHRVVFMREADYEFFLATMRECRLTYHVKIYAYCLMSDHVHLLLEPPEETGMLGKFMKRLAGRQTRYVNRQEGRRGTLWESRYKSSAIQAGRYLMACCRYIDLDPVSSLVVDSPDQYRWSSYRSRIGEEQDSLLDPIPGRFGFDTSPADFGQRYKKYVAQAIPEGEWELIGQAVRRSQLTGDSDFVGEVEKIIGRRIELRGRGRPRKTEHDAPESNVA